MKQIDQPEENTQKEKVRKRDGTKNLIPITERSKDEQKRLQRKGGIRSGIVRREKKAFKEAVDAILQDECKVNNSKKTNLEEIVAATVDQALSGDRSAREFLYRICGVKSLAAQKTSLFIQDLQDGKATLEETALKFDAEGLPLPEGLRLMLSRAEPKAEDPTNGQYCIFDDEAMEKRMNDRQTEIGMQTDGLQERRKDMDALHKEYSDHFSPDKLPQGQ